MEQQSERFYVVAKQTPYGVRYLSLIIGYLNAHSIQWCSNPYTDAERFRSATEATSIASRVLAPDGFWVEVISRTRIG